MLLKIAKGSYKEKGRDFSLLKQMREEESELKKEKKKQKIKEKKAIAILEDNNFSILEMGFYNVNRLKINKERLNAILDFIKKKWINILGIAEMNLSKKKGKFILKENDNIKGFWFSVEEEKKKGSGVGIIIDKHWEKYIVKINKENPYILDMILDFKGLSINIIIVYVAPTSLEVQKNIKEYLKKYLKDIETKKKAQRYIVLDDFNMNLNQTINSDLKEQARKEEKKQIAQLLRKKRFADIFYEPNLLGQPT